MELSMKKILTMGLFFLAASQALGISDSQLKRLEGYTLIRVGEITGWQNSDGKRGDAFEGCDYGRRLFIDGGLQVTCQSYSYSYSYRPTAFFFKRGSTLKMIIENDVYDVTSP